MIDQDVTTKTSSMSVAESVSRLEQAILSGGGKIFAVIDQSEEARTAGLELRDTILLIFGNPRAGTAVMDAEPLAALDLPLKLLVWDDGGETKVSYVTPACLAARYELPPALAKVLTAGDAITDSALSL